ncbi:hypothetical protein P2318_03735 [Myxococcaceae bacterium GXIMD 01537]
MSNQQNTDKTILLGEAPKAPSGFAFDPEAFSTEQIAGAIGVNPHYLYQHFWVTNVFDTPQASKGGGFDRFSKAEAVKRLRSTWLPNRRIVCVGRRVADALEEFLGVDGIPENNLHTFYPDNRRADWHLGYIIHPSACREFPKDQNGVALPQTTQQFLRWAASLRG